MGVVLAMITRDESRKPEPAKTGIPSAYPDSDGPAITGAAVLDLDALLRQLAGDGWVEQARAIQILQQMGAPIVEALTQYLQHEDVLVRQGAVKALLQMRWIPGFQDTSLGHWLQLSVADILRGLLRSDPSLLYPFLHDNDKRFRDKVEPIAGLKDTRAQRFTAVYAAGDRNYDEAFTIEREDGTYQGECGMTIAEFAAGAPDHAIALEIWWFDSNDICTVARILMSEGAYGDQTLRERLASRGDTVRAQSGQRLHLVTRTLEMEVMVVEVEYSADAGQPARNCFARLVAELTVCERRSPAGASREFPGVQLTAYQQLFQGKPEEVVAEPCGNTALVKLGDFTAVYRMGEPDYDEAFDISNAGGRYGGQCGLALTDPVGRDYDQAIALQAWLWDTTDPYTRVKVLMSEGAYRDTLLRSQQAGEYEALPVRPGTIFALETSDLFLRGQVERAVYTEYEPYPGVFAEFRVRLQVFHKSMQVPGVVPGLAAERLEERPEELALSGELTPNAHEKLALIRWGAFTAVYRTGETDCDEAFDISDVGGRYLGQCGLALTDPVGRDCDQAAAFQVWLWDKSKPDTRSKVKVLMSEGAYQDTAMRDQLAGEYPAIPVRVGSEFELETRELLLRGTVEKVEYGEQGPYHGVFTEFQVMLQAFSKKSVP